MENRRAVSILEFSVSVFKVLFNFSVSLSLTFVISILSPNSLFLWKKDSDNYNENCKFQIYTWIKTSISFFMLLSISSKWSFLFSNFLKRGKECWLTLIVLCYLFNSWIIFSWSSHSNFTFCSKAFNSADQLFSIALCMK